MPTEYADEGMMKALTLSVMQATIISVPRMLGDGKHMQSCYIPVILSIEDIDQAHIAVPKDRRQTVVDFSLTALNHQHRPPDIKKARSPSQPIHFAAYLPMFFCNGLTKV